ncbi:hypothetical protein C8Q79DRAFT_929406 [Trametes meyenii]|nr:hypothetical protein C8Q79DRAFT_929406 [Trametes meyenii]
MAGPQKSAFTDEFLRRMRSPGPSPLTIVKVSDATRQARKTIQDDIDAYGRAVADLKTRLNTLTPIGRLPEELLSQTLVFVAMDSYEAAPDAPRHSLQWFTVTHVCRHWRRVAHASPRYWSYIRTTHPTLFEEVVERTKSVPLYIRVAYHYPEWQGLRKTLDMIARESHRAKEIRVEGQYQEVHQFCKQLSEGMKLLETLSLIDTNRRLFGECISPPVVPMVAAAGLVPRLRELVLRNLPFTWGDPIFRSPSLTTLVVSGRQLLTALKAVAPRLQFLELENCVPEGSAADSETAGPALPTISLSSLRRLHLVGSSDDYCALLNYLSLPHTTSLDVKGKGEEGSLDLMRYVFAHASRGPPLLVLRIQSISYLNFIVTGRTVINASDADTDVDPDPNPSPDSDSKASLGESDDTDDDADSDDIPGRRRRRGNPGKGSVPIDDNVPTFRLEIQLHTQSELGFRSVVREGKALFASVRHLALYGEVVGSVDQWANFFRPFVGLRKIVLDRDPSSTCFAALSAPYRVRGQKKTAVLLPRLQSFELRNARLRCVPASATSGKDLIEEIERWVKMRSKRGIPLDNLHLEGCSRATMEDLERLDDGIVTIRDRRTRRIAQTRR